MIADVSRIFANTNAAAAGEAIAALILTQVVYGKVDLTMVLNGALAGLVSITAEPLTPTLGVATLIGAVGGLIVVFFVPMLDKFKIDDVVGAIPVHLIAGIGNIGGAANNSDAVWCNYQHTDCWCIHIRGIGCRLVRYKVDHRYPCVRVR